MPSPFPGMNPYLEREDVWHNFHKSFMPLAVELLNAQVGPHYIVKMDEHLYVHEEPTDEGTFLGRGDVTLSRTARTGMIMTPRRAAEGYVAVSRSKRGERRSCPFNRQGNHGDNGHATAVLIQTRMDGFEGKGSEENLHPKRSSTNRSRQTSEARK